LGLTGIYPRHALILRALVINARRRAGFTEMGAQMLTGFAPIVAAYLIPWDA